MSDNGIPTNAINFIDLSQIRVLDQRYREYDRLTHLAEIEAAMMRTTEGPDPLFTQDGVRRFMQKEKASVSNRLPYDPTLGL